jgi:hypothetical protein
LRPSDPDLRSGLLVGDFNRDNKPDIAFASYFGGAAAVLLGDGKGGFSKTFMYPVGYDALMAISVGDHDGDGQLDLAIGKRA